MSDKLINDKKLMLDWDYQRNSINPENILDTYRKSVYWVCHICGHKWHTLLDSRTLNGCGCPVCGRSVIGNSIPEYLLYYLLMMFFIGTGLITKR